MEQQGYVIDLEKSGAAGEVRVPSQYPMVIVDRLLPPRTSPPIPPFSSPFLRCQLLDHVEDPMLGPFPSATAAGPGVTERGKEFR